MGSERDIDAAIVKLLASTHFSRELAAEGVTTVSIDEHGQLVEHRPNRALAVLTSGVGRASDDTDPAP